MPVVITLGGRPCVDAIEEARNLARLGYTAPPEFARANCLLNPRGEQPARGWFLMLGQDLAKLNANALQTLTMIDGFGNSVEVENLVIAREPACLTPSLTPSDPNACYLIEVADARWRCHNPYYSITINAQYNVRAPGYGGQYYKATLNSGENPPSPWTWEEMVGNIWGLLSEQLGEYPGLPIEPDGVPERYRYLGVSAWRALCQVLAKLGLVVIWNATEGAYAIVVIGDEDDDADTVLGQVPDLLIFNRIFPAVTRGRMAAGVRVCFHRVQEHYGTEPATAQDATQFITSNVYTVDVDASDAIKNAAEPGTHHPLWDDLPALYDPAGNLLNAEALNTRAQARANAYYATIQGAGGNRRQQIYSGLLDIAPGGTISGVCWRQDLHALGDPGDGGGALVTEIVTTPTMQVRVSDNGQFEEALPDNSALHPPDLRIKEPVWPDLMQLFQVTATGPDAEGMYAGNVVAWNADTLAWLTREAGYLLPQNLEALVPRIYKVRLIGARNVNGAEFPVYATDEGAVIAQINSIMGYGLYAMTAQSYNGAAWNSGASITGVDANST